MNKQLYRSNVAMNEYFHTSTKLFLKEVYDIMKECYGPYGSHILIDNQYRPEATKDGKTILSKIKTDGTISSAVHGSIISVANKQVDEVGDGSTSTILLLCKLYESFMTIIEKNNASPSVLNKTIKTVVSDILDELKNEAEQIVSTDDNDNIIINYEKLYNAIHTSVDGDSELAGKILEMFKELNCVEPLVTIELSNTESHRYELVKGIETSGTIIRPDIFFNGLSRMEYENPEIVVVNGRFDMSADKFMDLAQHCIQNNKNVIFLATGLNETTLDVIFNMNRTSPGYFSRVPVFQIRNSALDEEFNDLCASIGAKPVDSESFKRVVSFDAILKIIEMSAGKCSAALLTEFCARFNNPQTDENAVKLRIQEIDEKIMDLENDPTSHNDRITDLRDRKAFLSRHYAKFYVGGYSPQRKSINYELANDGIPQAISCMKHGIVPGCNIIVPLIIDKIYSRYTNNILAQDILNAIRSSYTTLTYQLAENKLGDYAQEFINTLSKNETFNLRNGDTVSVINSADTDRAILQNATDMASLLATSKAFISRNTEFDVVNKGYATN